MSKVLAFLSLFLLSSKLCYGNANVVPMTRSSFEEHIRSAEAYFVMFYAPWCKLCTEFEPVWNALAESLNADGSKIAIGKVDCIIESKLCHESDITGYPTLKFFKQNISKGYEYKGTRDLTELSRFLDLVHTFSHKDADSFQIYKGLVFLDEQNFDKFIAKGQHFVKFYMPWCQLSQKMSPVWANLASLYASNESVKIGKVDCSREKAVCQTFDIKDYPHMAWISNGKIRGSIVGYHDIDDLKLYIEKMAEPENHVPATYLKQKKNLAVARISEDTFDMYLENNTLIAVNFFATWCAHCKLLSSTWLELGLEYADNEQVIIAEVDCTQESALCLQERITDFPTLLLYRGKKLLEKYEGLRNLESLKDFINKHLLAAVENKQESLPAKDEL